MAETSNSSPTEAAAVAALLAPVASDVSEAVLPVTTATALLAPVASEEQAVLPSASTDLGAELGSQRPVLDKENLAGTVGFHERHVFLCYKGPEEWPSHLEVEATESDRLPCLLDAAIRTKLTICEGEDGTESSLGDVLIFPDMIRYRGLTHFDVDNFVEEVLVKDIQWLPGSPEALRGSYVFVCAHGSRDKRCSDCGPALITRFKEEIEGQGLSGQVAVSACSHVGGHKYARNVIIFRSDAKGEVTGHWYGCITPDDVSILLQKDIEQGEIVDHLWRGQVGSSKERHEALELNHETIIDLNSLPLPETEAEVEAPLPPPFLTKEVVNNNLELQHSNGAAGKSPDPRLGLAPHSDPVMKLRIPKSFDGDAILVGSELYQFTYARELQNVINKCHNWLTGKLSLALAKNGSLFAVPAKDVSDLLFQKNGAVCVVENDQLPHVVTTASLYSTSNSAGLREHKAGKSYPCGIKILKSEFGGNRWLRRKYSIKGDDAYHVLQWRPRQSDSEDKLKGKGPEEEHGAESNKQSKSNQVVTRTANDFSIMNCIHTAEKMQELSVSEKAKAFDIFRTEQNRQIFICAEPATRLVWLRKQMIGIPD